MIKRISITVITLIVVLTMLLTPCLAAVTHDDFTVKGINLLSSNYDSIVAKLGEPKKKINEEYGQPPLTHLSYPGLKISVISESGQIVHMVIDNGDYQTKRGVKVGATPYKITKAYGKPYKTVLRGHVYYIYDTEPAGANRLIFDMTEGYASKIIYTTMPLK
ncbi:MAG: hypothetical protein GX348_01115 [Veillonellaceae bacterium]|nr:hypothetical protein [Veillonellaceae bacterium]